jgi:hypothetical protein
MGDCVRGLSAAAQGVTPLASRCACQACRSAPGGDEEPGVVEPGRGFGEQAAVVGVVPVQNDHELPVVVGKKLAHAALVRYVAAVADAEHVLIPADTGVDIGHGERDVVDAGTGDAGHVRTFPLLGEGVVMRSRWLAATARRAAAQSPE